MRHLWIDANRLLDEQPAFYIYDYERKNADVKATEIAEVLAVLRRLLRAKGLRNADVASRMGTSEATIKRWFAGKALTVDRLAALCDLAETSLGELTELAGQARSSQSTKVTLAQEEALAKNHFLSFLIFSIIEGWPPSHLTRDYGIPSSLIESQLDRLERLALIDRLPGGRVRARVHRRTVWRGPLRQMFQRTLKQHFMDTDFADPKTVWSLETSNLSQAGVAKMQDLMEKFRHDIQELADEDRKKMHLPKRWHGTLFVVRPFDISQFKEAQADDV